MSKGSEPRLNPVAKTLADSAYERIRRDIVSGRLAAGTKLRLETLTQQYNVGMSPLREALSRLVGSSLVIGEGQRGFWVAPLSIEELEDITRVRGLIETEALYLSIEHGGPEWERQVRSAFEELSRVENRLKNARTGLIAQWEDANRRFHEALVSACGSPWLIRMRGTLHEQAERYRRISLASSAAGRCVHEEHVSIFEAAMQRQPLRACRLTEMHLKRTAETVRSALQGSEQRRLG